MILSLNEFVLLYQKRRKLRPNDTYYLEEFFLPSLVSSIDAARSCFSSKVAVITGIQTSSALLKNVLKLLLKISSHLHCSAS